MTVHGASELPDKEFTSSCQAATEAAKWWIKTPDNEFFPRDEVPMSQSSIVEFYKEALYQEPKAVIRKLGGVYDRAKRIWVGHWLPK